MPQGRSRPLPPAQARTSNTRPNGQPSPGTVGNTTGIITPKPSPNGAIENGQPTKLTDPPVAPETPKEASFWSKAGPWVHGALGVASFVPGLSVVTGGADAAIYTAEGNYLEASLSAASMIPGGKVVTTAGKLARGASRAIKGAHEAEEVVQAARVAKAAEETARAEKAAKELREVEEAAKLRRAREAREAKEAKEAKEAESGGKPPGKKNGGRSKGRKKLKCGEFGKYGDLKKKTGDGKFDRDHIPSKAALKARAEELAGEELSKAQKKAIEDWGNSIAIPRQAHIDVSPTHGQSLADAARDSKDLAGAARRDVNAMLERIDEYDADGACKKSYQKAAKRVLKDNKFFDEALQKILDKVK